jgi:hypothetical protein
MNWNDYEAIWKRQELPVGALADLATLKSSFETKRRKFAATLFARDLLEAGAGLLVAGTMAKVWWHMGSQGWPMVGAILPILGVSGFFLRERFRVRRIRLGPDATLLAKVNADIRELRHQRQLLLGLWRWYLGPCLAAMIVFGFTVARAIPASFWSALKQHPSAVAWIVLYLAVVLPLCFWGAWALNRRVVRKNLEPRIAELVKLHADLVS